MAPAGENPDPATSKSPAIHLHQVDSGTRATFDIVGLNPLDLAELGKVTWQQNQWNAVFAVYVAGETKAEKPNPPPMLGTYKVEKEMLRFEPRFPLIAGIRYRAVFEPSKLPRQNTGKKEAIVAEFTLAKPAVSPNTVVEKIYPSADKLPENQLKFYIYFSTPMSRGGSYQHIQLLNSSGKRMDQSFLELEDELWDPAGKRFTLIVHPGRIKRGLTPREELGPVLEEGKTYTLVIDRQWNDSEGNPLKESFRKTFQVQPPQEKLVDPKTWKLQPPSAGTAEPLEVRFPKPLDHALLNRLVWVIGTDNRKVTGKMRITNEETGWTFTPET
ncbi:MAG TPA: hypothetical protein VGY77_09400, partial [Gemmataceae bacterium]|nr:hypothetical protein [Gemmataceae bacterium]